MNQFPDQRELMNLLISATEIGFKKGLMVGKVSKVTLQPYISLQVAHDLYGRKKFESWIKKGFVKAIQDGEGTKIRFDLIKCEIVAATSNF